MRDYVIYDMYTDDRMFRYEVYKHPNGMYEVCVQSRGGRFCRERAVSLLRYSRRSHTFYRHSRKSYRNRRLQAVQSKCLINSRLSLQKQFNKIHGRMTVCQMQALSPDRFYLYKILYCRLFHPVFWRFGFIDIVAVAVDCNYAREIFNLISANSLCA